MKHQLFFILIFFHLSVKAQVTANAGPDQQICIKDTLKVTGTGLNSGDTGSYQWKDLNTNTVISTSSTFMAKITIQATRTYELTVNRLHNNLNYTDKDTFVLTVIPLPTFKFSGLSPRCYDDGCINLTFATIATAIQGDDTSKKFYDLRYYQLYTSWVSGGPVGTAPYKYCPQNYILNSQLPATGFKDTICYDYTDVNGCYNYECKPLRINPNPVVQVVNALVCQKGGLLKLDNLVMAPFNKAGGIQSWRCLNVPAGSGVDKDSIIKQIPTNPVTFTMDPGLPGENWKTGDYIVEYCFKNATTSCQRCDTATVNVITLPEIAFDKIPGQCINGPMLALDSFAYDKTTGKRFTNCTWKCIEYGGSRNMTNQNVKNAINNGVKSQKYFDPQIIGSGGQYLLKVTDNSSGCPVSDSVSINVNGLPQVKITVPDSVCSSSGNYQLLSNNYSVNDSNGYWVGENVRGDGIMNSDAFNMGPNYSKLVKTFFFYRNPLTNCINSDSTYVTIIKRPVFKILQVVQKNSHFLVDFAMVDSNMNLSQFDWLWDLSNGSTSKEKSPKDNAYLDSGKFTVYLSINNGLCDTRDSVTFQLNYKTSSMMDVHWSESVYPNPVSSELSMDIPIDGSVYLYDINGRLLLTESVLSNVIKRIDMQFMEKGIYLLNFRNNETNFYLKIIKE